ncbi:hypothetical protein C8A00DRAFT_32425 [Chaetomidium leptoderma]|uniref:Uncharacterized protein n=1 Tax=Chaetomidium leptoderma TaxID=669021 RepID=A0AAN6VNB1_9PEZI|nr:hypothetical protein C8A00DRAFT_32425 [Chaetomidium leptoderma]
MAPLDNKNPPSFFIVPSEKRNYKSSIKLGNVIYQIQKPHLVLFDPDQAKPAPLAVSATAEPKTLENYRIEKGNTKQTKVGLFAKLLAFFNLGADVSHQSGTDASEAYTIKRMTIAQLDPTAEFFAGLKDQRSIMDILKDGRDPHAFLITGVVTASGVVFQSADVRDGANEASLGLSVQGAAPLGFMGKRSKKRTLKVDWEDPGPTVLAFSVQKLLLKDDGELGGVPETDGAYFGDDDDEPRQYDVEFDAKLTRRDVAGLVAEVGKDRLVDGEFRLYLPDE